MVIQGESGLMDVTGFPETGPTKVGVAITDCLAALYAVQGILLAHIQRQRTGKGQFLDIALLDSAVSVLGLPVGIVAATGQSPGPPRQRASIAGAIRAVSRGRRPGGRRGGEPAAVDAVLRGDGRRAARARSAVREQHRSSRQPRGVERASSASCSRTRRSTRCSSGLSAAGVPCGRVRTIDQVLRDPQLAARQMLIDIPAGAAVGQGARQPGQAVGRSGDRRRSRRPLSDSTPTKSKSSMRRRHSADA